MEVQLNELRIQSLPYHLKKNEVIKKTARVRFKSWLFTQLILSIPFVLALTTKNEIDVPAIILIFVPTILFCYSMWRQIAFLNAIGNASYFIENTFWFNAEKIVIQSENGNEYSYKFSNFISKKKEKNQYLANLNLSMQIVIPFEAFQTPEDQLVFEKCLFNRNEVIQLSKEAKSELIDLP